MESQNPHDYHQKGLEEQSSLHIAMTYYKTSRHVPVIINNFLKTMHVTSTFPLEYGEQAAYMESHPYYFNNQLKRRESRNPCKYGRSTIVGYPSPAGSRKPDRCISYIPGPQLPNIQRHPSNIRQISGDPGLLAGRSRARWCALQWALVDSFPLVCLAFLAFFVPCLAGLVDLIALLIVLTHCCSYLASRPPHRQSPRELTSPNACTRLVLRVSFG
jgi:hypothetical protein